MLILPKPLKKKAGDDGDDDEAKEFAESYKEVSKKVKSMQVVY
jgi:hypothetical protein